jgi:recombination endonuclease VII
MVRRTVRHLLSRCRRGDDSRDRRAKHDLTWDNICNDPRDGGNRPGARTTWCEVDMSKRSAAWVTSSCAQCGDAIEHWRSQPKKYCSKICRYGDTVTFKPRPCEHCRSVHTPTHARQRWCVDCVPNKDARGRIQRYGINDAEWQQLAARYDGRCWICKVHSADCVDHCHETGVVRGALCRVCNMALHYVERPGWWSTARAYLRGDLDVEKQGLTLAGTDEVEEAVGVPVRDA